MKTAVQSFHQAVFKTELGWFAVIADDETIQRVIIGYPSRTEAAAELHAWWSDHAPEEAELEGESPLVARLKQDLIDYAAGEKVDFSKYKVSLDHLTPFQQKIARAVQKIPAGNTRSYADVAKTVGSPRAARAVGNVMAQNRVPVLVPCHRVLATSGKLGGFSAPGGIDFKSSMLALEAN